MGKSQFSTLRLFQRRVLIGVNISFNSWVGSWGNSCWHEAAPWGPFSQANCTPCGTGIYPRSIQITISRYHLDPSKKENSKRIIQHSCTWNVKKHNILILYLYNIIPHNVDAAWALAWPKENTWAQNIKWGLCGQPQTPNPQTAAAGSWSLSVFPDTHAAPVDWGALVGTHLAWKGFPSFPQLIRCALRRS